jgi:hypothetical protein
MMRALYVALFNGDRFSDGVDYLWQHKYTIGEKGEILNSLVENHGMVYDVSQ